MRCQRCLNESLGVIDRLNRGRPPPPGYTLAAIGWRLPEGRDKIALVEMSFGQIVRAIECAFTALASWSAPDPSRWKGERPLTSPTQSFMCGRAVPKAAECVRLKLHEPEVGGGTLKPLWPRSFRAEYSDL